MVTDSGVLQEETSVLKISYITIRENIEQLITFEMGSKVMVGTDSQKIIDNAMILLQGSWKSCGIPELWDGLVCERIADALSGH